MVKTTGYNIPRRGGWEEILEPLVKRITGAQQADCRGGCHYDSALLYMKPHVLGSCICTYGKEYYKYQETHFHSPQCFHTFWQEIDDAFKAHPLYHESNILKSARVNEVRLLAVKNGIKYDAKTLDTLCTCPYQIGWNELGIEHDENCEKVAPNFWYKPSDLKIWWYKFFFRDAFANQEVDIKGFEDVVNACLIYVNEKEKECTKPTK